MILLFTALTALMPQGLTADWYALLQTDHTYECSADYLLSGKGGDLLCDGLPLASIGSVPASLPWRRAAVTDPLQSGIWGGGEWNTWIPGGTYPDTLSESRIGLIQNTADHSRYIFELDRPLPANTSGSFFMRSDDTLSVHSAAVSGGSLRFRAMSWEGNDYGWGGWAMWKPAGLTARAGFSRLYAGDRRPELLAAYAASTGSIAVEAGAAGAYVDSTVEYRIAGGTSFQQGSISLSANVLTGQEGTGIWGGATFSAGDLMLSALHSSPRGEDGFQSLAVRHENFSLVSRLSSDPALAADISVEMGILRGKAAGCWFFQEDSLQLNCHGLLGADWFNGRLEAGPRFIGSMNDSGEWNGTVDAVMGFTLLPFSLAAGVEDITDGTGRSWSFGITWSFTDRPPESAEEGENDR